MSRFLRYKRCLQAVITAAKRSSRVCVHVLYVYAVSAYGKTSALLDCTHSSIANLSQMHQQTSSSGLGKDVTL